MLLTARQFALIAMQRGALLRYDRMCCEHTHKHTRTQKENNKGKARLGVSHTERGFKKKHSN